MSNVFERANYPEKEPIELVVGDYWAWKKEGLATDYPTSTYSLSYEFHCDSGGGGSHQFTINATEADDVYRHSKIHKALTLRLRLGLGIRCGISCGTHWGIVSEAWGL